MGIFKPRIHQVPIFLVTRQWYFTNFISSEITYFLIITARNLSKERLFVLCLCCLFFSRMYKILHNSLIKEKSISSDIRMQSFQLDSTSLCRSLASTNLRFLCFLSISIQLLNMVKKMFMQEVDTVLIMRITSAGYGSSQTISAEYQGQNHSTPQGCCLLCPFGHQ